MPAVQAFLDRLQIEYDLLQQAHARDSEQIFGNEVVNQRAELRRKHDLPLWQPLLVEAKRGASDRLIGLLDAMRVAHLDFLGHAEWMDQQAGLNWRLAKADIEECLASQTIDDGADVRADGRKKSGKILPDNDDVTRLANLLIKELPKGEKSRNQIAAEFTPKSKIKSASLLRKIREYPDLKSLVDRADPKKK